MVSVCGVRQIIYPTEKLKDMELVINPHGMLHTEKGFELPNEIVMSELRDNEYDKFGGAGEILRIKEENVILNLINQCYVFIIVDVFENLHRLLKVMFPTLNELVVFWYNKC